MNSLSLPYEARPRRLTRLYIVALSVVAALSIAGQALVQWQLAVQWHDSHVVNVAGRQRMLSQRLAKLGLQIAIATDDALRRRLSSEMAITVDEWRRSHVELQASNGNSLAIRSMFRTVDVSYQAMLAGAQQVVSKGEGAPLEQIAELVAPILQHEARFLEGMDLIVSQYDSEAAARVGRLRVIEVVLLLVTLTVLAAEAWFLFRPAVQRLNEAILALRRAARALSRAKQTAEQANRAKSDFLAKMSHELRTPMNAILGLTELTLGTPLDEQQRQYLSVANNAAESLLHLLNDTLDMAKIEAGRLMIERRPFEMRGLLASTVETYTQQAHSQGLGLYCIVTDQVPQWLECDAERVRQIVSNLVSNAIKFTAQGRVSLHVTADALDETSVMLKIVVRDTGIGIPADRLPLIFEAFTQVHDTSVRSYGGTGLGLAIVEQLVKQLGGVISVESEVGFGSAFHVTLPCRRITITPPTSTNTLRAPGSESRPLRVLVAEDTSANQLVMRGILERHGHRVVVVDSGHDALAQLKHEPFDVALVDVQMPDLDGLQAIAALRDWEQKASTGPLPVIAVTAWATAEYREQCLAAGMNAYLTKPVRAAQLIETIERLTAVSKPALAALETGALTDSSSTPIYDRRVALERLEGNQLLWGQLLRLFQDESPGMMAAIATAVDQQQLDPLAVAAHRLKGFVSNFAAQRAFAAAAQLEQAAREAKWSVVPERWQGLEAAIADLRLAMFAEIETLSPID